MSENPEAKKEEYDEKQKEVENIANPIMRNMYAGGAALVVCLKSIVTNYF